MKTAAILNRARYICFFYVILFTSIFLVTEGNARPFSKINAQCIHENDSIKIGKYLIKIIHDSKTEYGYDIYVEKKLFIHQPTVPALPGNSGFATKTLAEKVARKVVEKMQEGESLPTITVDEMERLDALPHENTNH